ncbi:MAG: MFS transporter [Chitinophagaceae bacterium]|nr:MAG: MFS transporter [Chitinophagaceae bacterium]
MALPQKQSFILINKEFTWFIVARVICIVGLRMTPVLLGWKLYELTGSKLALGMLGLSEVIPAILFALPAGVTVDKSNKHRLIRFCMFLYFLIMAGLLLITSNWFAANTSLKIIEYCIYAFVFCTGIVRAFSASAFTAFVAQLVPSEFLIKAASINSMSWLLAAVTGPAIAGILLGYTTISFAFFMVCFCIFISILLFQFIQPKPIMWQSGKTKTWDGVKEGLRFVYKQKALLGAMNLDMFAVLFGGAAALLPVFAKDILHIGPTGLGWLIAATYLGNFVALAWITNLPLKNNQGIILLRSVIGFGICILVFALSKNYWLSFAALFISGLFDGVSIIIRHTMVQLFVPDEMRGRVSSVNSIFINSSNELGQFESGVAASIMGTVPSVIFGGSMTLLVTIVTWIKAPSLRKFTYK